MNVECLNLLMLILRGIQRILVWTIEKSLFTWAQMPLPETAEDSSTSACILQRTEHRVLCNHPHAGNRGTGAIDIGGYLP